MPFTSRDYENFPHNQSKSFVIVTFLVRMIVPILRPLTRLSVIQKYISRSPSWYIGGISRLQQQKDYERASATAIRALERFHHQTGGFPDFMRDDNWWMIMMLAVTSLQHCEKEVVEKWEKLIQLAKDREPSYEGYDVAYSYLAFSRWKIREKAYDEAIAFAKIASDADETWGEPDFLLGRCSFLIDAGDPIEHLAKAIKKDHRMLFRISNDTVCKRYPHIIAKLKELAVADGMVMDRGGTMADDEVKSDSSARD